MLLKNRQLISIHAVWRNKVLFWRSCSMKPRYEVIFKQIRMWTIFYNCWLCPLFIIISQSFEISGDKRMCFGNVSDFWYLKSVISDSQARITAYYFVNNIKCWVRNGLFILNFNVESHFQTVTQWTNFLFIKKVLILILRELEQTQFVHH